MNTRDEQTAYFKTPRLPAFRTLLTALVLAAFFGAFFAVETRADDGALESAAVGVENDPETDALRRRVEKADYPWRPAKTGKTVYLPRKEVKKETPQGRDADFGWLKDLAKIGSWAVLAVVVVIALVAAAWAIRALMLGKWKRKSRLDAEAAARERRISTLAPEAAERYDDLLAAAQDAFARGDYRYALIFYFSYLLVEMDKRNFILLEKGKTNLVYWRELTEFPELRSIYRLTMKDFERVYFGGVSISREEFDAVWALHDRFLELMRDYDEEESRRRDARESASEGPSAPIPTQFALFIAVLALASCLGCKPKEKTWERPYGAHLRDNYSKSLNSATTYLDYCRRDAKWRVRTNSKPQLWEEEFLRLVANRDAVLWFDSPIPYSTPLTELLWQYVDESAGDRADRVAVKEALLREYAAASADDFGKLSTTSTTAKFYKIEETVERWLEEKPNRVFVVVGSGWDAYPYYFLDARQELLNAGADANDPDLQECDAVLQDYMRIAKNGSDGGFAVHIVLGENHEFSVKEEHELSIGEDRRGWSSQATFFALRTGSKLLLESPKEHAAFLLREYGALECEEAGEVLPDGLKEEVVRRYGGGDAASDGSSEPTLEERWRRAYERIKSEGSVEQTLLQLENSLAQQPYGSFLTGSAIETKFDDGRAWQTGKGPRDPSFVTRVMPSAFGDWPDTPGFGIEGDASFDPQSLVRTGKFSGDPEWTQGLPEEARLYDFCRIEPRGDTKVLLAQGGVPLVCERKVGQSRLLIVNSGYFMSNYGLTDPVNQKLAARLAREIPPKARVLVSLTGFTFYEKDAPKPSEIGRFSLRRATPFTVFIWHMFVLGACLLFWAYPIFGRPKRLQRERRNDFSRHINAYAGELEKIGAREWAQEQIDAYRESDHLPEL